MTEAGGGGGGGRDEAGVRASLSPSLSSVFFLPVFFSPQPCLGSSQAIPLECFFT